MRLTSKSKVRRSERRPRWGRVTFAAFGRGGRLVIVTVGLLLAGAPAAWSHHVGGLYEGTNAQGDRMRFTVGWNATEGDFVCCFYAADKGVKAKTDLGQDCTPIYPPPAADVPLFVPIVDHAFSDATRPLTFSGSFTEPMSASGTLRITTDVWWPPPGELPQGSTCDTGTVSWTASCSPTMTSPCSTSPTFRGAASGAKVSTRGRVTLPLTIGCPPPGDDCRVSVAATGRVPASAAAGRKRVKLGRSDNLVKAGSSAKARFTLSTKGRRLLRRLKRIKAKAEITVTRGSEMTKKTVAVRLKAPSRTP